MVDIIIPKSVKKIRNSAFYCHNLENINIPEGVVQIRSHAFWACEHLSNISLPSSLQIIDASAFYTTKIKNVSLPHNCKYQGVRHGFPHEMSFPKNCVVTGGILCDLYEGV